ncbi:MAG: DsbA family oxidoreductase [Rhizobiaceae bacterium]
MAEKTKLNVDIVSDVMCPWCYVGQKRLERAMDQVPEVEVDIHWRPFQLDPTLPPEGKDRKKYLSDKFGGDERAKSVYQAIKDAGVAEGIPFDFDAIKVAPNTLDAHRLIRWASSAGEGIQNRLARRLFQLYFEEGANIGDHRVLIDAARDVGMDNSIVESLLATDSDREAVQSEIATAGQMGVTGVPCFLIEGKYAVMGAQDSDTLANAFRQIAEAKKEGYLEQPTG